MRTFLLCLLLAASATAFAQIPAPDIQWQKSYGGGANEFMRSIIQTSDGGYIMTGESASSDGDITGNHGNSEDYWVVKLNSTGGIQWQKSLGGNGTDRATCIRQTPDGGYIVAGYSGSNDGDITGNHGILDYWVVKLNSAGDIQWQKSYGGSNVDYAFSIELTTDGGYVVAGWSKSSDGDVTGHHGSNQTFDYWVVKLANDGAIQWQKSLGGSADDWAMSIQQTTDGGYVVAGMGYSFDGDVTGHHGGDGYSDVWVVKLTSSGSIQWQKSYGGSNQDGAGSVKQTSDGGYIIAGSSNSINGNVTLHHGTTEFSDVWVLKLTGAGALQWQKSLGGSSDDGASEIQLTADGGYVVAGTTSSSDGDVAGGPLGAFYGNFWVLKLTAAGSITWHKSMGSTETEGAASIVQTTDRGYIIAGRSNEANGDVTVNKGGTDGWVVKLKSDTSKHAQTITFPALPVKRVGSADFTLTASASSGLPVTYTSNDTTVATIVAGNKVHIKQAGTTNITARQAGDSMYDAATYVTQKLTIILKSAQTITFPAIPAKVLTDADFSLNATAGSGLPVTYTSSDTTIATIVAGNKVHIKNAGTTNITASQGGDTAYNAAAPVTQLLTIMVKSQQTITFPAIPAKTLAEADFSPNATASSGLVISYSSSDTAVATIVAGNKIHLKNAGTANITAAQEGNANFEAATPVTRVLTVSKANQTISFPGLYRTASSGDFALNANSSAGLPVTYTVNDTTVATIINGNTVHVKKTGSYAITAIQGGNAVYNPVTVTQAGFLYGTGQTINFYLTNNQVYQLCNLHTTLYATATSGLPVSFTSSDTTVISVTGNTMYFKKAGIAIITARQAGDVRYYQANPVDRRVRVIGTDTTHYTPAISIYYTPALQTICEGNKQLLTFKASIKNGGSAPAYQWKKNNKNVGTNSVTYVDSFYKAGTDSIWCILTTSAACVVNNTAKSNTLGITVHTLPTDTLAVKVISYIPNACLNRAVTFQASIKHGGPAPFYQWKKNGINVGKDSSFYVDSLLLNTDTVWCVVTGSRYCGAISQVASNKVVQGVVYIKPGTPGAIRGLSNVTAGQQRVGYGVDRVNDVTYEWAVPAGATILAGQGTNQIVVTWGTIGGNVTVRAKNPCGLTDKSVLAVTVAPAFGIVNNSADEANSLKAGTRVQLYPNPAVNTAYVDFTAPEAGKYFIQVTDAQGRVLQTKETNAVKGNNKVTVDVSRYAKGVYFVRIAGVNRQQSLRLLIQR